MHIKLQAINYCEWNSLDSKPKITLGIHQSPWGNCIISQAGKALCGLSFGDFSKEQVLHSASLTWPGAQLDYNEEATAQWISIASSYLKGTSQHKEHSLLLLGTPFQLSVWTALLNIPTGKLLNYKDIANGVGRPSAVRAVGTAIGKNKISLLVPCHRVIQSSGKLGGYAWGLDLKRTLLDHEGIFIKS